MAERPLGVTIICILGFLGAILLVLGGIAMVAFGGLAAFSGPLAAVFGGIGVLAGILFLIFGAVSFIVILGLWKMKKWAWTVTMVLEGLSLLMSLFSLQILGIIISGVIVYYLWTKKALFA